MSPRAPHITLFTAVSSLPKAMQQPHSGTVLAATAMVRCTWYSAHLPEVECMGITVQAQDGPDEFMDCRRHIPHTSCGANPGGMHDMKSDIRGATPLETVTLLMGRMSSWIVVAISRTSPAAPIQVACMT
ncbi:hypothetical protein H257_04804 [Aphanomyces astaci]|uniref:Uncharacterized protein n=1 Tax=Aphanomyces astaci TaxID=112090 RepID=W4GVZ3_APHAT|nr:hypothetical protein H257_04804 [Aphanomyces astaci]ETV83063.1 hypothetical protein H257_04804 [Aphanomyces astaci]|eukprot:XP_009827734.1 hypothetical protein H257_04804 [Aphanomyces astaci]